MAGQGNQCHQDPLTPDNFQSAYLVSSQRTNQDSPWGNTRSGAGAVTTSSVAVSGGETFRAKADVRTSSLRLISAISDDEYFNSIFPPRCISPHSKIKSRNFLWMFFEVVSECRAMMPKQPENCSHLTNSETQKTFLHSRTSRAIWSRKRSVSFASWPISKRATLTVSAAIASPTRFARSMRAAGGTYGRLGHG